jgi:hypothetical protein
MKVCRDFHEWDVRNPKITGDFNLSDYHPISLVGVSRKSLLIC